MAALARIGILSETLFRRNTIPCIIREYAIVRNDSAVDLVRPTKLPDELLHSPDPYPKTKEEREKAAAKYNMHPYEYKPMPNDHRYSGDYPDLPWIGSEARDPYYPWDYPHVKRNYEEPIHKEFEIMTEDRYAFGVRQRVTDLEGDTSQPMMEKQLPYSDRKHYTFNLVK